MWHESLTDGQKRGALQGLRVVDLSRVLAGPFCTQVLGDHGADVIKIESPVGDETRGWGPPFTSAGVAAYFDGLNRNKRGIVLDLSSDVGREQLWDLLSGADVVIENFKPGTMRKWGFDSSVLAERFPKLIQCSISAFGPGGPLGGLPGYDAAIQGLAGLMSVNGEAEGGPLRLGVPVVDLMTGMNAALGIMLALQERHVSGFGQVVDIALFDCALSMLHPHSANFLYSGVEPKRTGSAHSNIAPYESFATGNGLLFLAVGNDKQFQTLCQVLEVADLAQDRRFSTNSQRVIHRKELKILLEESLIGCHAAEVAEILLARSVPCSPILSVPEALSHPQTAYRDMVLRKGDYRGIGMPIKLSRSETKLRLLPPGLSSEGVDPTNAASEQFVSEQVGVR